MKQKLLVAALSAAFLAACGGSGGNGGSESNNPPPPVVPEGPVLTGAQILEATETVIEEKGLSSIPANVADETYDEAYDVVADNGGTYRIYLKDDGSYRIKDLRRNTPDQTGTSNRTEENQEVLFAGTGFNFKVNTLTNHAVGNVRIAGEPVTVSGSIFAVTDLSKLEGNYVFMAVARNAADGKDPDVMKGGIRIDDKDNLQVCSNGQFDDAGKCVEIKGFGKPENVIDFKLTKNATTGVVEVSEGSKPFGILHVHAGDRGLGLIIDRYNAQGQSGKMRNGTFYAAPKKDLTTGDLQAGSYSCSFQGQEQAVITFNGSKLTIDDKVDQKAFTEILKRNQISNGKVIANLKGMAIGVSEKSKNQAKEAFNFLPISSTLMVAASNSLETFQAGDEPVVFDTCLRKD